MTALFKSNRRAIIRTVTAMVTAGAVMAVAQPAVAQTPPSEPSAARVIRVAGTSAGFTMADSHPAGFVTFQVSSSHPQGGLFALWKLRRGATLNEVLNYAMMGLSNNRPESVEGGRGVQERADVLGGAAVLPGQPVSFTSLLLPGTYHVVNYQDLWEGGVPQAAARARALTITSQWSGSRPPPASATSVFTLTDGEARYRMPAELRSGRAVRMVNAMPQLTEAVFMPVRPGTTREQMQEFFAAADRDDWSVPAPFTGGPVGLPALSPGHTTILEVSLQPGQYALVTWYPNLDNGTMLAAQGQFALVTIT